MRLVSDIVELYVLKEGTEELAKSTLPAIDRGQVPQNARIPLR